MLMSLAWRMARCVKRDVPEFFRRISDGIVQTPTRLGENLELRRTVQFNPQIAD